MRSKSVFRLWLLTAVLLSALHGAEAAALSLEETLQAMPPQDAAAAEAIFAQVLNEPDALMFALCERIVPPDQAPDAGAQFALYGLAKHVVRPGLEAQRVRVARVFEVALDRASHPDVRRFFMAQLRVCGDATTLRVLEPYVCDPVLFDDAVQSIAAIGGFQAVTPLFMRSCPDAPGMDASVQNAMLRLSGMPDYTPEETGLDAELLAAMADPDAVEDKARIAALCRAALTKEGMKPHCAAMTLRLLARVSGKESQAQFLAAANAPAPILRGVALALAEDLPGEDISREWIAKLPEFSESVRPEVISMLGGRGDPVARQAVLAALADPLPEMRLAACRSVSREYGRDVTGPLMDALKRADSEREIQAVKDALLRVPGLAEAAAEKLQNDPLYADGLPAAQRAAGLEIIAERRAEQFLDITRQCLADADPRVRRTACAALAAMGAAAEFDLLYERLLGEERDAEADAARNAIAALANRTGTGDVVAETIGGKMAGAAGDSRARLVKALGALNSPKALEVAGAAAEQALFGPAPDAGYAAVLLDALGVWQAPEAGTVLLGFWQRLQDEPLRLAALKNYIVSVQRNFSDAAKQGELLSVLSEQCRTDAERQAVAEAIAKAEAELNKK